MTLVVFTDCVVFESTFQLLTREVPLKALGLWRCLPLSLSFNFLFARDTPILTSDGRKNHPWSNDPLPALHFQQKNYPILSVWKCLRFQLWVWHMSIHNTHICHSDNNHHKSYKYCFSLILQYHKIEIYENCNGELTQTQFEIRLISADIITISQHPSRLGNREL